MVMYVYDENVLMTELTKNIIAPEIASTYKYVFQKLTLRRFKLAIHWIENKSSTILKLFNQEKYVM